MIRAAAKPAMVTTGSISSRPMVPSFTAVAATARVNATAVAAVGIHATE